MSKKTGTKEWAESTENMAKGCSHNCRYCYARCMLVKQYKTILPKNWTTMQINHKAVNAKQKKRPGTIMTPSSHDITPEILPEFLIFLGNLLDAGNNVLIVSKPHSECIKKICYKFSDKVDQIMFRFTIGSMSNEILSFWEPGAPDFQERLKCLKYAYDNQFQTSVSCEPYLDDQVEHTYRVCRDYITDSFWIGELRKFKSRVNLEGASNEEIENYVKTLQELISGGFSKLLHQQLNNEPFIKWKESVREAISK